MNRMMKKNATVNPGATTKARPAVLSQITYKPTPIDRLKSWWKEHFGTEQARKATAKAVCRSIDHAINSFARAMKFNLLVALVAMLVINFCPEVVDKCPVFFQLCEGILIFYEFMLRVVFTLLKAFIQFFTLNWAGAADSLSVMLAEGGELLTEFIAWVQSITF